MISSCLSHVQQLGFHPNRSLHSAQDWITERMKEYYLRRRSRRAASLPRCLLPARLHACNRLSRSLASQLPGRLVG